MPTDAELVAATKRAVEADVWTTLDAMIEEHRALDVHECDWDSPDARCDIHFETP